MSPQLPKEFLDSLQNIPGFDEDTFVSLHSSGEQVTCIRLNPGKNSKVKSQSSKKDLPTQNTSPEHNSELITHNYKLITPNAERFTQTQVPWSTYGYYLSERPSFTLDPVFHAGGYYVQDASSMFLEEVLKQSLDLSASLRVLDLCAAPGGKSTLLQSVISPESLLVSNEINKARVSILIENISKWGCNNVVITNNEAKDFQRLPGYFDVIVADAPCSGSGLFRKDAAAIKEWSIANVEMCAIRQQKILKDVLPALKEGGILIYSTCSYSEKENEEIADWLFDEDLNPLQLKLNPAWNIVETFSGKHKAPGYRFYPDKLLGEGFFIAAFKKVNNTANPVFKKNKFQPLSQKDKDVVFPFINQSIPSEYINWQGDILALPQNRLNDLAMIQSGLYIKKAGVKIGTIKSGELIPHHELAMSNLLSQFIPLVHVDLPDALNYLRRLEMAFIIADKGWKILKYDQLLLGWIKSLGNRINNYYPKEWRILNK